MIQLRCAIAAVLAVAGILFVAAGTVFRVVGLLLRHAGDSIADCRKPFFRWSDKIMGGL